MRAFRVEAGRAVSAAVALAASAAMLAGGCGPSDSDGADGRPGATEPRTPADGAATPAPAGTAPGGSPPAPTAASPAPAETLVRATRSGGYAGGSHTLLVKGDGSWTRLDAKAGPQGTGMLSGAELAALRTALREADFARLPRTATGGTTVYDGFTYVFVHGGFEVAADQEALAPALRKVLDALPPFTA